MFQEDQSVKTTLSRAFTKDLSAIIPGFYAVEHSGQNSSA
jgi:hypothetical protein